MSSFSNNANNSIKINGNNNSILVNPFGNNNIASNNNVNSSSSGSERRIFKFNNKIYPFNGSNVNLSNLAANIANNNFNSNSNNNNSNISVNFNSNLRNNQIPLNNNNNNKTMFNSIILNNNNSTNKFIDNSSDLVNDQLIENMLSEVSQISSKDDIKTYLKTKMTNIISKFFNYFNNVKELGTSNRTAQNNKIDSNVDIFTNNNLEEKVDAEKISELEKKLNNLESNNKQLKQVICTIYNKYEVNIFNINYYNFSILNK